MLRNARTKPLSNAQMSELKVTTQKAQEKEPQRLLEGGYTHHPRIYHQRRLVGYRTSNHRDKGQGATRPARHTLPNGTELRGALALGLFSGTSRPQKVLVIILFPASLPGRMKWTHFLLPGLCGK